MTAANLCLLAAGVFFLTGMLTGVWKYRCMASDPEARTPVYVDIAHRTALLYSFAAILLREFVPYSPLSPAGTLWAAGVPLLFFGSAISSYIVHGLLRDTDNQLRKPHRLGSRTVPGAMIAAFMWALILGEIGGFLILFAGFLRAVFRGA
jgi:hypothetical protein